MYNGLHQLPPGGSLRVSPRVKDRPSVRIIPFDYVAAFDLEGKPGRLREDVINISVEGTFIALAVGYGLVPDMKESFEVPATPVNPALTQVKLSDLPPHVLMDGFRFNPALERIAFTSGEGRPDRLNGEVNVDLVNKKGLFEWVRGQWLPEVNNFDFLYNIIDTGTGRELQNAPIHNISGLGKANGERPFRMLAKPLAFLPRSSVRIQVEEKSERIRGRLFIVLHGYKILGAAGVAEEHLRGLYYQAMQQFGPQAAARRTISHMEHEMLPSARLVPFDYVGSLELSGKSDQVVETEIPINVEGGFVATSIGYSLAVNDRAVVIQVDGQPQTVNLGGVTLAQLPIDALKSGFRIKDAYQSIAFQNGRLSTSLSLETVNALFEPLNQSENVRFTYAISDSGTGREWQNKPVLNIAGLGIANGDRPFRNLAWPMHFLPRSTLALRVRELFGKGRLFIVFQGYKTLGVPL